MLSETIHVHYQAVYRLVHLVPVIFMIQQLNCVASSMLLSGSEQLFYLPLCASESILCRYGIWLQFQLFMEWQCSFTWWQLWLVQKVRHALMHRRIDTIGWWSKLFIFGSYFSFSRYHSFWCFVSAKSDFTKLWMLNPSMKKMTESFI